jgi:hypothetical protein
MTVNINQDNQENILNKEKVDTTLTQQNNDVTSIQKLSEEKKTEVQDDPNFKAFREARKKDKAEREAAERRATEKEAEVAALKAAMEAAFSKSNTQPQPYSYQNNYPEEETEDQKIDKKVQAAIAIREAASEKARIEREQRELPQRITQAYPDYHQVVNEENGAYLEYHYPELYRSLLRQPENFETLSDTYKLVKKFVPNSTTSKKESSRADSNFSKPKSISTTTITQSGQSASESMQSIEQRRAANWARMQQVMKGVS